MSAQTRRRSSKTPRWLFALLGLGVIIVVLGLFAPMFVMSWVRGYLQKEAFRGKMEQFFGSQLQGSVTLAPLRWTGDEVTTQEAHISTDKGWKADLNGLHLALDWNAFRQSKWRVINTGMDALSLSYVVPSSSNSAFGAPPSGGSGKVHETLQTPEPPKAGAPSTIPAWLRSYLPSTTEVDGVRIDDFSLAYGPWKVNESKLRLGAWQQGEHSVQATIEGGIVETPIQLPVQLVPMKFNLTRATTRLSRDDLHLSEAIVHWLGDSEITVNGHIRPKEGSWKMSAHLVAIPLREVMSDDWKLRLTGLIEGDLDIEGSRSKAPSVEGDVQLKKGVLTAMPILDKLATYTGVDRFKRIILDIASAHVRGKGETRQFDKIIIQSNGLVRIEGSLFIQGGQVNGNFMLGVTPETLKWIPGAQKHVFTGANPQGPPGMLWTPLRVTGTIDSPREDLTDRLIGGAGKALLNAPIEVVTQGTELLLSPVLGKDAAKKPGDALKGATDAAGKAAEKSIDLLKGFGGGLLGK
ncbi:MAG: hypothetical protein ABL974_08895 [Prosthecobacter sp.]